MNYCCKALSGPFRSIGKYSLALSAFAFLLPRYDTYVTPKTHRNCPGCPENSLLQSMGNSPSRRLRVQRDMRGSMDWVYSVWMDDFVIQNAFEPEDCAVAFSREALPARPADIRRWNVDVGHGVMQMECGALGLHRPEEVIDILVRRLTRFPLGPSGFGARRNSLIMLHDAIRAREIRDRDHPIPVRPGKETRLHRKQLPVREVDAIIRGDISRHFVFVPSHCSKRRPWRSRTRICLLGT